MAKVDKISPETIERLRGKVDFYLFRGITHVARRWPKKPKPPYTALQAEGMAVFAIGQSSKKRISDNMREEWRKGAVGKREAWGDTFIRMIMKFWKKHRCIAPIALDYSIEETESEFRVKWTLLRLYIDKTIPEVIGEIETLLIKKEDILKMHKPIYVTISDEENTKFVAPYILFEVG